MSALQIVRAGQLEPRTIHTKGALMIHGKGGEAQSVSGISLTRDRRFAHQWGQEVVFELDQQKLRQRYRIAPVDFMSGEQQQRRREEREEFLISRAPLPLNQYLKSVMIAREVFDEIKDDDYYTDLIKHPLVELV